MKNSSDKRLIIYIIVIISFFGCFSYYKVKNGERYQLLKNYTEKANDDIRVIDNNLLELERTLQYISKNPILQKVLLGKYSDYLRANKDITENVEPHFWYMTTRNNKSIDEIKVYAFKNIENVGYFIYKNTESENKTWYKTLINNKKIIIYSDNNKDIYMVYPIYQLNYSNILGAIEVKLNIKNIARHLEKTNSIYGYKLLIDKNIVLEEESKLKAKEVRVSSRISNFELVYQIKDISMLKGSFTLLLLVAFCEFFIIFITLQYNKKLKKEHLEILDERKKRIKLENTVLKARISPHFLYNILSMINWKAKYSGQDEISDICLDLSEFYRTALNKGLEEISIKEELDNVEAYIKLKSRLTELPFTYEIECKKEYKDYKIINFILQPIVENALIHGIGGLEEGGHISIEVEERENDIYIKIVDNGIDDIDMEKIFANKKGYGLKNVDERIKLTYGKDYGIFAGRNNNKTEFVVKVPKN